MKVLITRPRAQADDFAERLREAGFEPIYFPVIEIRPIENNIELEKAIKNIEKYDWVVFTSANAVDIVVLSGAIAKSKRPGILKLLSMRPNASYRAN